MFISAKATKADTWYYGIAGKQCGQAIALFKDESCGKVAFPYDGSVLIVTGCRSCKARKLAYAANDIKQYRA